MCASVSEFDRVCLGLRGEQVSVCAYVCMRPLLCVCMCGQHGGEQVCLCVVLTEPDNGHIWKKKAGRRHMQTYTHTPSM